MHAVTTSRDGNDADDDYDDRQDRPARRQSTAGDQTSEGQQAGCSGSSGAKWSDAVLPAEGSRLSRAGQRGCGIDLPPWPSPPSLGPCLSTLHPRRRQVGERGPPFRPKAVLAKHPGRRAARQPAASAKRRLPP
ncbi:uncharacterized protein PSFLO_00655 [Pseudozyma flocculosa]|uniref:Uncharacterized protein n=1 Tax=Pseudozyma flocculosa TaxID=84751 RepID=A0A5C3ES93_9BASI|nr:uncharacterized protein PSFLO_00655 [Pseudozyma flocculosa]